MLVRFGCPVCGESHSFDMPETTIHMTCSRTGRVLRLKLGLGGEVRPTVVGENGESDDEEAETE